MSVVPLALAAPAAVAGLAYLNARTSFGYDMRLIGGAAICNIKLNKRLANDRLNPFYILEEHAQSSLGDKTFLIYDGRNWTYKEVYVTALKYGTWFKTKHNVKSKEIVAINFMNSEKFIFLWLGLWAIGAKPAFINYNLTDKALVHCIKVSTARLVLVDPQVQENITQNVRDELAGVQVEVFAPELEAEAMAITEKRERNSERSENSLAALGLIIFTSGTTGLPKGAIVSWRKIISAGMIVPYWNRFSQNDIIYTASNLFPAS